MIFYGCDKMVGDEMLEKVNKIVYLGCVLNKFGRFTADIERRVTAGKCE